MRKKKTGSVNQNTTHEDKTFKIKQDTTKLKTKTMTCGLWVGS